MLALGLVLVGCDSAPPPVTGDAVDAVQATVDSTSAQNPMVEILAGEHRSQAGPVHGDEADRRERTVPVQRDRVRTAEANV